MALKDWKKTKYGESIIAWRNRNSIVYIEDYYWAKEYVVKRVREETRGDNLMDFRRFKTKPQALAYAKQYMRTH